jgi:hypothetical protein
LLGAGGGGGGGPARVALLTGIFFDGDVVVVLI